MKTQCPECLAIFSVHDSYLGKKAKCVKCQKPFLIVEYGVVNQNKDLESNDLHPSPQNHNDMISLLAMPTKFRQYMHENEKILYASTPSLGALVLKLVLPGLWFLGTILSMIFVTERILAFLSVPITIIFIFFSMLVPITIMIFIFFLWKNCFYIISDKRTFASKGIFNIAIRIIPNKNIQMICINTGIIDRLLGLNTLEISSAAHGGANIFQAFTGMSKGSINFSQISDVHKVLKLYHSVFE